MSDLASVPSKAPFFRRLSTAVAMTITLILMPIAMLLILTGPIYRKRAEGWQPISNKARYIYGGILVVWLIAATVKALLSPGGIEQQWADSADPRLASNTQSKPTVSPAAKAPAEPEAEPEQPAPPPTASTPDMRIAVGGEYNDITITADDGEPFIIERVILNSRAGDKMCDFGPVEISPDMTTYQRAQAELRTQLPTKELRRGDSIVFGSTCGQTLEVAVHTNRGVSEYEITQQ